VRPNRVVDWSCLAKGLFVGDQAHLVVGAAFDEVVSDLGQPLLRKLAQVVDVDHAVHASSPMVWILACFAAAGQRC
jgi:hypothetical protein